jgi:triacylglycerol lipase
LLSVAVLLGAALLASCTPAPGASLPGEIAEAPTTVQPVLLVPGWELGCSAKPTDWDRWRDAFVDRGLPQNQFVVLKYNSCQPNLVTAQMIETQVQALLYRSGAKQVTLIAHSMGVIPARWCISFGACAGKVADLVTVAGANHGTIWAAACALQFWARSCVDLRPDSQMLRALNVDESPDGVRVETWVSPCEQAILPRESAFLAGAINRDLVKDCVDHTGWKSFAPAINAVAARLVPNFS